MDECGMNELNVKTNKQTNKQTSKQASKGAKIHIYDVDAVLHKVFYSIEDC